ncbi:alpha/beta hydrolase [Streptomyces sp. CBMA152]|uniref:alpha/beta hydrolase n=1 Tax=Streptomyces sp. CBMA152 TaxID=1896312 RepID=UPI0016603E88|nr:alpha/beta hydrolase [Streptomyces sp. CBMA152]MBD0742005.1 hypothetical protein [Streptomyces sp. CBMA152]
MPTWQQLRDVKLSEFTEAAGGWGKVSSRANAAKDRVDNEMHARLHETQQSKTAEGAVADIARLSRNYQYLHTECGLIRTALDGLATELAAPQKKLQQALEDAENLKFTVEADGSVKYPVTVTVPYAPGPGVAKPSTPSPFLLPGKSEGGGTDPNKAKADDIAARISGAVRDAAEIDGRYAGVLRRLKSPAGLAVTDEMLVDAAADTKDLQKNAKFLPESGIPKGKSPAENKKWWDHLSQEERDEYTTLFPERVGALDGLPSPVRDDANRMVLAETHAQVQLDLNKLGPEPQKQIANPNGSYPVSVVNPGWTAWDNAGGSRLTAQLKGINAIEKRFADTGVEGLPEAYLLGFDTQGNGHAIVANGNPDTAQHTAVYVPGTKSKLEGASGDINRMTSVWRESQGMAPGQSVSTITWIGYDAPQSIVPEAMEKSWAHDGSPKLNQFLDGLQTTQGGADKSHTTVIGHSYGSTVVGDASNRGELAADDIVVAGSPGMLAGDAGDLDVGKKHVWSEATGDDLVPAGGKVAGLGGYKWGIEKWHGIPFNAGYIQYVPSDEAFGAHRMQTDTSGHSGYWDSGSVSLHNQAAVVAGQYDQVKEAD